MSLPATLYANVVAIAQPKDTAPKPSAAMLRRTGAATHSAEARLRRKVDQANRILARLEDRVAAFDSQIKEYQRCKAAAQARYEAVEAAAIEAMEAAGVTKVQGVRTSLSLRATPAALTVFDVSLVPPQYLRATPPPPAVPDKALLKAALASRECEDIDPASWGCRITSRTTLIRK